MTGRIRLTALLLLSMSLFAVATWAGIAIIDGHQENATLIAQNHELIAQGSAKDARAAAREDALLGDVHVLLLRQGSQAARLTAVSSRLAAVLTYLHRAGIHLPTVYLTAASAPSSRTVVPAPKAQARGKHKGKK